VQALVQICKVLDVVDAGGFGAGGICAFDGLLYYGDFFVVEQVLELDCAFHCGFCLFCLLLGNHRFFFDWLFFDEGFYRCWLNFGFFLY